MWIIAFILGSLYWLQVKEMLKWEVQKAENESNRNTAIITEYKQVTFPENIKSNMKWITGVQTNCLKTWMGNIMQFSKKNQEWRVVIQFGGLMFSKCVLINVTLLALVFICYWCTACSRTIDISLDCALNCEIMQSWREYHWFRSLCFLHLQCIGWGIRQVVRKVMSLRTIGRGEEIEPSLSK
jgi:hypothetical protein